MTEQGPLETDAHDTGSPLSRQLLARGDDLTLYNRGKTESRAPAGIRYILGDRKDYAAFERQMAEAGTFDCVIDMVCFTPEEAASAIRAFKGRTRQFIFCSTVDVYSKPPTRFPVLEHESRHSRGQYGLHKARCEDLFMEAHARGDFAVTIVRPAHTYGEGGSSIHTFASTPTSSTTPPPAPTWTFTTQSPGSRARAALSSGWMNTGASKTATPTPSTIKSSPPGNA